MESPIRRHHSPFCDSTGPIVQEGFVAARVRALQKLQSHARAGNRSHSPMIPCPPRLNRSYVPSVPAEHFPELTPATDKSVVPLDSKPGRQRKELPARDDDTEDQSGDGRDSSSSAAFPSQASDHKPRISGQQEPHEAFNQCVHYGDVAIKVADTNHDPKIRELYELPVQGTSHGDTIDQTANSHQGSELSDEYTASVAGAVSADISDVSNMGFADRRAPHDEIFGPLPISANLANSSALPNLFPQSDIGDDMYESGSQHDRSQRLPRKSVADKLDSLVQHGWVTADSLNHVDEGSYGQRLTSMIQNIQNHQASNSVFEKLELSGLQSHGSLQGAGTGSGSQGQGLAGGDSFDGDEQRPSTSGYHAFLQHKKADGKHRHRSSGLAIHLPQRSSSDAGVRKIKSPTNSVDKARRAWSLSNSYRTRRSSSEGIELRDIVPAVAMDDRIGKRSSISTLGSLHNSARKTTNVNDNASNIDQNRRLSGPSPPVPDFKSSRVDGSQLSRGRSRATSWFRKDVPNPFVGEKESDRESPTRSTSSTTASATADGAPSTSSPRLAQPLRTSSKAQSTTPRDNDATAQSSNLSTPEKKVAMEKHSTHARPTIGGDSNVPKEQNIDQFSQTTKESSSNLSSLTVTSKQVKGSTEHQEHQDAAGSSGQSQRSSTAPPTPVPVRRSSRKARTRSSKASSSEFANSHSSSWSQHQAAPVTPRHRSITHEPSVPVSVQISRQNSGSSLSAKSKTAQPTSEPKADFPNHERVKVHSHCSKRGRGRGIKSIQVTITFDGSEDIVVEATTIGKGRYGMNQEHALDDA